MDQATTTSLTTLRDLYVEASNRYEDVRCTLVAVASDASEQMSLGAERFHRQSLAVSSLLVRSDERRQTLVGEIIVHSPRLEQPNRLERCVDGADRFSELASRAGHSLLNAPQEIWNALEAGKLDADTDLGILNDLWIHGDRFLYRRESALKIQSRVEAMGGDASSVVVPMADDYYLRRLMRSSDAQVWCLALFNLVS